MTDHYHEVCQLWHAAENRIEELEAEIARLDERDRILAEIERLAATGHGGARAIMLIAIDAARRHEPLAARSMTEEGGAE